MNRTRMFTITAAALVLAAGQSALAKRPQNTASLGRSLASSLGVGILNLVTDNSQHQIEIIVGPNAGEVQVSGISGIPSGTVFYDIIEIDLLTGNAFDFVEFRFLGDVVPVVRVNTQAGESDVKFTYEIPTTLLSVAAIATVTGGSTHDKVHFNVVSSAPAFIASWNVTHGEGENSATAAVFAPEASDLLSINMTSTSGAGQDKLEVATISDAAILNVAVNGSMGASNDAATVLIDSLGVSAITSSLNLDLGAGEDAAEFSEIARGGTSNTSGIMSGGDDKDALVFKSESTGSNTLTLDGGAGDDLADMQLKGEITGAPMFLGGADNDELKLVVDGPQLAMPFFDGGPGFDKAIGFGTFVNVEQIN